MWSRTVRRFKYNDAKYVVQLRAPLADAVRCATASGPSPRDARLPPFLSVVRDVFTALHKVPGKLVTYAELEGLGQWESRCPEAAAAVPFPRLMHYFDNLIHDRHSMACRLPTLLPRLRKEPVEPTQDGGDGGEAAEAPEVADKAEDGCEGNGKGPEGPEQPNGEELDDVEGDEDAVVVDGPASPEAATEAVPELYTLSPQGEVYHEWVLRIALESTQHLPQVPCPIPPQPPFPSAPELQNFGEVLRRFVQQATPTAEDIRSRRRMQGYLQTVLRQELSCKSSGTEDHQKEGGEAQFEGGMPLCSAPLRPCTPPSCASVRCPHLAPGLP